MNRMLRPALRVAVTGLFAAFVLAAPTPALAANDRLLVSSDGVNFVPNSTFPLFTSMGKVVPGDSRTEHVWVMNNSSSSALLRVDMVDPSADDAYLAAAFSLNVFPEGGTRSASVTIAQGIDNGSCTVLDAGIRLGAGERLRLDLTADIDAALAAQQGTLGTVEFQLRGLLTEAVAGGHETPGSKCIAPAPDVPSGDLTHTGGSSRGPLEAIAAAAVLAGTTFGLLAWRRRRQDETETVS